MNWSLSKLGTFTKCRRRFLYAYIQRLPGKSGVAASRGVDQHAHIERFFKEKTTLPPDIGVKYTAWFEKLRGLEHYSENQLAMREGWLPCSWEDPAVWWKGVLDLKVLQRPKAWVFDWKTGKVYPDHEDQKELYSIATFVEHEDINEIEAWHIYLDLNGKDTKKIYTREQLPTLIAKWNVKLAPYQQALSILAGEYRTFGEETAKISAEMMFVANPTYLCDYCPYSKGEGGPCQFG